MDGNMGPRRDYNRRIALAKRKFKAVNQGRRVKPLSDVSLSEGLHGLGGAALQRCDPPVSQKPALAAEAETLSCHSQPSAATGEDARGICIFKPGGAQESTLPETGKGTASAAPDSRLMKAGLSADFGWRSTSALRLICAP